MSDPTDALTARVVVVGGGLAAASVAERLRELGHTGPLTVVAGEPHLPYERPPLSKDLLLGKDTDPLCHDQAWYDEHDVDVRTGVRATTLDTAARRLTLDDGGELEYDRLVLATGAQARTLDLVEGIDAPVLYLRTLDDSRALQEVLGRRVLVIGGGWIGLEVAAAVRENGGSVTLVESAPQPLAGVLGEQVGARFAEVHREHGVDLRLGVSVEGVSVSDGEVTLALSDGSTATGDVVVVGVGAQPETALAATGGIEVEDGVLVDATLRTSDPHVWAVGDIAAHDHPTFGRIRVEHWDTAKEQGRAVAAAILGSSEPYDRAPYFFTDQYDLGMEYVGRASADDDVVIRGEGRPFTAFWLDVDGTVLAGLQVDDWDATDAIRGLVGRQVDRARLADPEVPLGEV